MTTAILITDSITGFLRTGRKVCNLRPAERIAVADMFTGKPVVVSFDRHRGAGAEVGQQFYGTVLAVATVEHGTCSAVLVLQLDVLPGQEDSTTPHALPLSQVLHIEEIVGLRAAAGAR